MPNLNDIFEGAIGRPDIREMKEGLKEIYRKNGHTSHPDPDFMRQLRYPGRVLNGEEKTKRAAELLAASVDAANEARLQRKHDENALAVELSIAMGSQDGPFGMSALPNRGENFFMVGDFQVTVVKVQ